jgi:hypothetical protein
MDIMHKDATITNTDDTGPGSFEVILSAPTKDRDGDTLLPDEWKQPLPDHITFDADHGMSVATTVGSGTPRIDEETGNLVVAGTYSSLPRAQEVRTLVNEGHIRTTSVAFMSEKTEKDGKTSAVRELLNGAFVAIPSNREALVLASKSVKAGARNSQADAALIQTMHDASTTLGADCSGAKSLTKATLDPAESPDPEVTADPKDLALAIDAAVDQALALLTDVDLTSLPDEVQRAIALVQTADAASDDLLDALGVPDPDEDGSSDPAVESAAAPAKAAAPAETTAADDDELQTRVRALSLSASTYTD